MYAICLTSYVETNSHGCKLNVADPIVFLRDGRFSRVLTRISGWWPSSLGLRGKFRRAEGEARSPPIPLDPVFHGVQFPPIRYNRNREQRSPLRRLSILLKRSH